MEEMHGDWLRVPFDSPLRDALKQQCATPVVVVVVVRFTVEQQCATLTLTLTVTLMLSSSSEPN